jgi:hypothetical protein
MATKAGAAPRDCVFLLDFSRPLERRRWLGIGPTVGLLVPVVHRSEQSGGYVVGVARGEAYFVDIPKLWKRHAGSPRTLTAPPIDALEVVADFGRHFAADC